MLAVLLVTCVNQPEEYSFTIFNLHQDMLSEWKREVASIKRW